MSLRVESKRRRRGIRSRLLVSVNVVAAAALTVLLLLDYRTEVDGRVRVMQTALEEEAKTLLPALRHLAGEDASAVQWHLDHVCGRMRESTSPGHHIAVRWGDRELQANSHGRSSPDLLRAMMAAAESSGQSTDHRLIVGSDTDGSMTVYVSELKSDVLARARNRALGRAGALGGLILAVGFVVNLILLRLVVKPIRELAATVNKIGGGDLRAQAADSATAELYVLSTEINAMSASLLRNETERQREMDMAREIQERLCQIPSSIPGMTVARLYRPADEVAGDYFDLLPLPDGSWLLSIADVVGHGIPAAMGAAILKALLVEAAGQLTTPAEILAFVNTRYRRVSLECDFASAVVIRWDPETSTVTYASAGHEPVILAEPGGATRELSSTGMVLGLDDHAYWETESISIQQGARLLLTTDGVTEARTSTGELFGGKQLHSALQADPTEDLAKTLARLEDAVIAHRAGAVQTDDITMMLARFGGNTK